MKTICTLIFLSLSMYATGQKSTNIDSLLAVYNNTKIDSIKLKTSNKITTYYLYRDVNKAYKYATMLLKQAYIQKDTSLIAKASHKLSIIHSSLSNYDSTRYYINNTLKLAKTSKNLKQQSLSQHSLVMLEISLGNLEAAQTENNKNIVFNRKINDTIGLALSYDTESSIHIEKGQYQIALKSVLKSLEIFEAADNKIRIADALNKIAVIENSLEHYDSSLNYSSKALQIYEDYDDLEFQATILNIMGISYKFKKENKKAIEYLERSRTISKTHGYKSILLVSQAHLIDIYLENQDNKTAKKLIDDALELANTMKNETMISYFKIRLGLYHKNKENFDKALTLVNETIQIVTSDKENLAEIYKTKSDILKLQGKYKEALVNFKTYKNLQDESSKKANIIKINELRIIHQTEQKEAEIAYQQQKIKTLNQEVEISNLRKSLYGGGMISFIALSGLLFFGFKQRIKKNKIEREKQEEIYKQQIAFKQKELASQTLHLVQKNTFIQELKENLEKIKKSPELFKVEFRRIVMLLKKESAEDKDWEVFKSYFSEVHNNFDNKLKTIYADITEKEIRLASFLRMNLSTKEIASMLNVLPDSVLKSKYRLKKKLNLDKTIDLNQFLNTL